MQKTLQKCIAVSVCGLLIIALSGYFSLNAGETHAPTTTAAQQEIQPQYTFSQYQGKLALYQRGFAMPVEIFDVYLDSLPDEERSLVTAGICAETDAEIQKIIEDYTS